MSCRSSRNWDVAGFELTSASVHVPSVSSKRRLRMSGLERLGLLFEGNLFLPAAPCGVSAAMTTFV